MRSGVHGFGCVLGWGFGIGRGLRVYVFIFAWGLQMRKLDPGLGAFEMTWAVLLGLNEP